MGSTPKKRFVKFDVMNILACIAVIAIHHNGLVHTFQDTIAWRQALVAEVGFYWCVPMFLMLTGATLIDYKDRQTTKTYFKRRFERTVIPWLFWSAVILLELIHYGAITLEEPKLKSALSLILSNKVENVFWYFDVLFPIYLAIPVISSLRKDTKTLWYLVYVNFFLCSVYPLLKMWFNLSFSINISLGGNLIIYVLLGYLLRDWKPSKRDKAIVYLLAILGACFRYFYTLHYSVLNGQTDVSIKGYGMFHAVFLTLGVFVFVNSIDWESLLSPRMQQLVTKLSSCSFGIYLVHRIVMRAEMRYLGIAVTRLLWRVCCIPLTYVVSLAIVLIIKQLPLLRKMVG